MTINKDTMSGPPKKFDWSSRGRGAGDPSRVPPPPMTPSRGIESSTTPQPNSSRDGRDLTTPSRTGRTPLASPPSAAGPVITSPTPSRTGTSGHEPWRRTFGTATTTSAGPSSSSTGGGRNRHDRRGAGTDIGMGAYNRFGGPSSPPAVPPRPDKILPKSSQPPMPDPPATTHTLKPGDIINEAHFAAFADHQGRKYDPDQVMETPLGRIIFKKRYMVVRSVEPQSVVCWIVTCHNKGGLENFSSRSKWEHVRLMYRTLTNVPRTINYTPWPDLVYVFTGNGEGQMDLESHVKLGDLVTVHIGKRQPEKVGELYTGEFQKLQAMDHHYQFGRWICE